MRKPGGRAYRGTVALLLVPGTRARPGVTGSCARWPVEEGSPDYKSGALPWLGQSRRWGWPTMRVFEASGLLLQLVEPPRAQSSTWDGR
jgi:hypothetical protein